MATESNSHQPSSGVRTYCGRTLEEILPQIHAELGVDAVIVSERAALVGGVGGTPAQRLIEVDARPVDRQSVIDRSDPAEELRLWTEPLFPAPDQAEAAHQPPSQPQPQPIEDRPRPTALPSALPTRRFETAVFVDRLRAAAAPALGDDLPDAEATQTPASEPAPALRLGTAGTTAPGTNGNGGPHSAPADLGATLPPRPGEPREPARPRAFGRLIEGLRSPAPARPAPAGLDLAAADGVARELAARGASEAWASQLIGLAGAHGRPLSSDLRAAAEAELARRILPAPALPAGGAAIAFVGAGGSGKTRCTAALASAYRRASTLSVTVLALDNPDDARELRKLLREDAIPVLSLSGDKARRAIEDARAGGLVIVDTDAATPTDPHAVQALQAKLEPLGLDAVYITLPATLGSQAARRALASFDTLQPSAVAITHADETDQLAVAVEIAVANRIPLAYFHSGTDHRNSLWAVNPPAVAQRLLAQEGAKHAPLGQLYGPDGTVVRVSITHRAEDILLVVLDAPGTLYDQPLTGLILESTGGRGVLRTPGSGQRTDTNLIRFFLDDSADGVRRRGFVRVLTAQRVMFVDSDDKVIANTVTANVSGGGMLVRQPSSVVLEGNVSFNLYLDETVEGGRISGTARVIRNAGDHDTAIGFTEVSRDDRERLIHFIFEKQRMALRDAR